MAKIKLNLSTGIVEKPILSCFKKDNNSYLILDAENVGNMGMPIIYVCKIVDNKVVKINDDTEWQNVKGDLKSIISGQKMDYFTPAEQMDADEVYFTQLTLSNENLTTIKNNYQVEGSSTAEVTPTTPENPTPDLAATNIAPENTESAPIDLGAAAETTVAPEPAVQAAEPISIEPTTPEATPEPEPQPTPEATPVDNPVDTQPTVEPTITPVASTETTNKDIAKIKEKFLNGCDMVFEAINELIN